MIMEKEYEDMLDKAYEEIPEQVDTTERFTVPRVKMQRAGRRTVIQNFNEIADKLRRDPEHLLKFMVGELATRADLERGRASFQGNFDYVSLQNLLEIYTEKYVICPVCNHPDTHLERERRLWFLQCEACGARSSIGRE